METKKHGPHGEYCGCDPNGVYVGMGCPNPNRPLKVENLTAMQMMLMDLEYKQRIYEEAGMFECATALVTSIYLAKGLIKMEKKLIRKAYSDGFNDSFKDINCSPYNYIRKTYGK